MPRTSMTVTTSAAAGTVIPALAAPDAANGNTFPNTGREWLEVTNGSGSSLTVTITTHGTYAVGAVNYAIADLVVTVAAGVTKYIGPFDKTLFNNTTNQNVEVDWSSATSITTRVISLGTA